jgi:DNA-binding MarR family transcriptional regulator
LPLEKEPRDQGDLMGNRDDATQGKERLLGEVDDLIGVLLQRTTKDELRIMRGKVTPAQFTIMRLLKGSGGGCTVSQVAKALRVTLSAVTPLSDRLVESGLVQRTRDAGDRRVVRLELTPKGLATTSELESVKRDTIAKYVSPLSGDELRALIDVLGKIAAALEEEVEP